MQRHRWGVAALLTIFAAYIVGVAPTRPAFGNSEIKEGRAGATPAAQPTFAPSISDLSVLSLLTTARQSLANLDSATTKVDRDSALDAAIEALTSLYQLHGCAWALPQLRELYLRPDAPALYIGYSADGRLRVRCQILDLRNPAFEDYTMFLVTLESNTSKSLREDGKWQPLKVTAEGQALMADVVSPAHPLWPSIENLAATFEPPGQLPSGIGTSYKQVFAVKIASEQISKLAFGWGAYDIAIPIGELRGH